MNVTNITGANVYQLTANKSTSAGNGTSFADAMAAASNSESTNNSKTSDLSATVTKKKESATKEFMDYMNMTPAQRMLYAWLKQHGVSKEEFDAMSPEEQQKLMDKMKQEIEMRAKMELEKKTADILA